MISREWMDGALWWEKDGNALDVIGEKIIMVFVDVVEGKRE